MRIGARMGGLEIDAGHSLSMTERPRRWSRQQEIVALIKKSRLMSGHFKAAASGCDQAERHARMAGKSQRPVASLLSLFPGESFGPQQPDSFR